MPTFWSPNAPGVIKAGGPSWWAVNVVYVNNQIHKLVANLTGSQVQSATFSALIKKTSAALVGTMLPSGTLTGINQKLAASMAGTQTQSGVIAATFPAKLGAAITAAQIQSGAFNGILKPLAAALVGTQSQNGVIAAQSLKLVANLIGTQEQSGTIAAIIKAPLQASITAQEIEQGTIAAVMPTKLSAALTANQTQAGTIGAALIKPVASVTGVELPEGQIAAMIPKLTANVVAAQTQSGTISALLTLTSAIINATAGATNGTITSSGFIPSASLVGGQEQSGVLNAIIKQSVAALTGTHVPNATGTLAASLIKAIAAISATYSTYIGPIFVGGSSSESNSVTPVTHAIGDQILILAMNEGTATIPTTGSGYTAINTGLIPASSSTSAYSFGYKTATATNDTSGTWTNANRMLCAVYNNASTPSYSQDLSYTPLAIPGTGTDPGVGYAPNNYSSKSAFPLLVIHGDTSGNFNTATATDANSNVFAPRYVVNGANADMAVLDLNGISNLVPGSGVGGSIFGAVSLTGSGEGSADLISVICELGYLPDLPVPKIKGVNAVLATTVAIPTHAIGDLIIITAARASTTLATKPAASGTVPAWVDLDATTGTNTRSIRTACFVATATNHTSGTWTNAQGMTATVISGQLAGTGITSIGGHAYQNYAAATDLGIPSITPTYTDGTSLFLNMGHVVWANSFGNVPTAPAGYFVQTYNTTTTSQMTWIGQKGITTSDGSVTYTGGSFIGAMGSVTHSATQIEVKSH